MKNIQFFPAMLVAVGHQCPTGGNGGWCNCPISSRQWGLGLNKHKLGEKSGNNGNKIRTMLFKSPSFRDLKRTRREAWFSNNYNIHYFLIYSIAKYSFKKAQAKSPLLLNLQSSFSLRIHGKKCCLRKVCLFSYFSIINI